MLAFNSTVVPMLTDGKYTTINKTWLLTAWKDSWNAYLRKNWLMYSNNQWDCDNFAWMYWIRLQWATRMTPALSNEEAAGAGVLYYCQGGDRNRAHAINFVCIGPAEWIAIEPQGGNHVTLSSAELDSIFFVHM